MRLRTIGLVSTLAIGLLATPLLADAQQAGKVYHIGYLTSRSGSPAINSEYIALLQGLRGLGYVEGQNLVIEYRSAHKGERPEVAAELVQLKVDIIVTSPTPPLIRAVQRATSTIPIVMAGVHVDPVEAGFVSSLARPGGNITGLTNLAAKLHAKQLELLKEAFPRIFRAAIIWRRPHQKHGMKGVQAVGQALGLQIQFLVVRGQRLEVLERAFSAIRQERPDGLLVAAVGFTVGRRARIIEFTAKRRLPTMYAESQFVKAGGLMSYEADRKDLLRRAATYVDKILKGAKAGDLPVEQPRKFDFAINLKTAKQLGVTIPSAVLYRADTVIK